MASGVTHRKVSIVAAGAILFFGVPNYGLDAVKMGLGCLLGIILSPDLDIDSKTDSELLMGHIPIIGTLFYWYWLPYALLIPHRHFISHSPVIGTLIRIAYFIIPALLLCWYLGWAVPWDWSIVYGLMVSDTLHWIWDIRRIR